MRAEPQSFFAHSLDGRPEAEWEDLWTHLEEVASLAERFAAAFGAGAWGRLGGLWHDLGKYQPEFQGRLRGSGEQVEHAGAGAALACRKNKAVGLPLAFVIAGHHSGLANLQTSAGKTPLQVRLDRNRTILDSVLRHAPPALTDLALPPLPPHFSGKDFERLELWIRFLFSCLVDADYLATERFYSPGVREEALAGADDVPTLRCRLDAHLDRLTAGLSENQRGTSVNRIRSRVLASCRSKAQDPPGLFSLTVPTGGGKTLAAMAFALHHAERWDKRRVIAAIPFTSILEQNADVYRRALGDSNVLEHHSALDPVAAAEVNRPAEIRRRLAAENWDLPVVVTTNVQLFESLFADSSSRCRKLHNLAGSVILLDEAQALSPELLLPILAAIRELVSSYGCTVVLSTATQPALNRRDGFPGLEGMREIVDDPTALARELERVEVLSWPDPDGLPVSYAELAVEIVASGPQVLAVVHRRNDARLLAELLPEDGRFHLSALMCPAHRRRVLDEIREILKTGKPCRLVSTQLIEAGVDVDFPVVFRALGGLDSLVQAIGRCNREMRQGTRGGKAFFFLAETPPPPGLPRHGLEATAALLRGHGGALDLTAPALQQEYFRILYAGLDLDARKVQPARRGLDFEEVARRFKMIEDGYTRPLVVPYGKALERLDELRRARFPDRRLLRSLQAFTVNVPQRALEALGRQGALETVAETVTTLSPPFFHLYDSHSFGLILTDEALADPGALVL